MSAKKIVAFTYLEYVLIALGALLLFTFVRQLAGGLGPRQCRALPRRRGALVALLFLLAQQFEGNVSLPRIMGNSVGVLPLSVLFTTLAATALHGLVGAIFAVPVLAIIAASRYPRGTLLFECLQGAPAVEVVVKRDPGVTASGEEPVGLRRGSAGGEG